MRYLPSLARRQQLAGVLALLLLLAPLLTLAQPTVLPAPTGSGRFGSSVTVLPNGNYVVTDPSFSQFGVTGIGAVYLYNGTTNALLSTLTGSAANDAVGNGGVTVLTNGNYVVRSGNWNGNRGATTWASSSTGTSGTVSATNSLTGSAAGDYVGSGITALPNGNYVVNSFNWNGNQGAATWGNGATGTSGVVSAANSLTGSLAGDNVGGSIVALTNGNYVVRSFNWNGSLGAVTWGNGTTGTSGVVSAANSLVGSVANDQVGNYSVAALTNGNYVVGSPNWNGNRGAATWANGSTGLSGAVSAANSLVGTTAGDYVGTLVAALTNGNYVVSSGNWNGNRGAVTWANGSTGLVGTVSAANSLTGSTSGDYIGTSIAALPGGNYVVRSPSWNGNQGAATWGNGTTGSTGALSAANSLVGTTSGDYVGNAPIAVLSNGNYVVSSARWNGNLGAATWGNVSTGTSGAVSTANSLTGTTSGDQVSAGGIAALTNGNYVVSSPTWNGNRGAATWVSGTASTSAVVSAANSLTSATAGDQVGTSATALTNGNYVVSSIRWSSNRGAATWVSGSAASSGVVSAANSLTGSLANDFVSSDGTTALPGGNYVVRSNSWNGNRGALTLGDGSAGTSGPVTACNGIVGTVANSGLSMAFAYRASTNTLLGGVPNENKVQVGIGTPPAPTGAASQNFGPGATVASLAATGQAVQWYAGATGGSALAGTTPLADGSTYYASQTVNGCESTARLAVTVAVAPANLTVSTGTQANPVLIVAGTYATITVTSTGVAQLGGAVAVTGSFAVSGTLLTACQSVTGAGSFALDAGATLGICSAQGISAAPAATGAIQNTGTRTFDADALYTYNGTGAQVTGTGLPATVRTLTLANSGSGLTLTNVLTTTTAATLTTGVLTTGANALTLGSAATLSETTTGYATGTVQTTRALSTAGSSESFGGLGLTLTPSGSTLPGSTFVARTTGTARMGVGTSVSVKRVFDIQPTVKTGLNVALALTIRDDERDGIAAANLHLYKSDNNGTSWQSVAGATTTATTTNGVPTYTTSRSGLSEFSLWTLGDATNPLPVQLTSFTAQAHEAAVVLTWRTASEANSARFEVERSEDGRTFALIGTVAAAGTSLAPRSYELLDSKLPAGAKLLYYRLRQVDLDGTVAYSQVQTVALAGAGLALYPNPARTTTLSGAAAGASVQVYNAVGALVLTTTADATGAATLTLPAGLPGGPYLVRTGSAPALRLAVE